MSNATKGRESLQTEKIWLGRLDSFYVRVLILRNLLILKDAHDAVPALSVVVRLKLVPNDGHV